MPQSLALNAADLENTLHSLTRNQWWFPEVCLLQQEMRDHSPVLCFARDICGFQTRLWSVVFYNWGFENETGGIIVYTHYNIISDPSCGHPLC